MRPVLAGFAINDELTKAARPVLARYYNDRYVLESSRAQFDIAAMRDIATRMAHNLLLVDNVLATLPTPPPSSPASADDLKVAALRKQFNDVEDAQRATINVIGGLAETESFTDLQNFSNPQALQKQGGNVYSFSAAAGPLAAPGAPNTAGLGQIQSGALESSNVDLASQMAGLITAQRAFEANAKIITTSDEVLQTLVNLKR